MGLSKEELFEKLNSAPTSPGVYIFKDDKERVLYIGKAKNLKNRIKSYFQPSAKLDPRRASMVKRVRNISYIITHTELEALALEANLIKQHRPKYNVLLRDDKNYPYLRLTIHEYWPKLEVVRSIKKDGALYFGPFIPASSVWETLSFIRRNFQIRPCKYNLDRVKRACIQYQMKRCPAPCVGKISREAYMKNVKEVEQFLKGKKDELMKSLEEKMYQLSEELRYEEAAIVRDKLNSLRRAFDSQKVVAPELGDMDIIGIHKEGQNIMINILIIRNGLLISSKDFLIKNIESISDEELLSRIITQYYSKDMLYPKKIIVPLKPEDNEIIQKWLREKTGMRISLKLPSRKIERQLLSMAKDNAKAHLQSRHVSEYIKALEEIKEKLSLEYLPESIGAFDISTTFGAQSVGAFVWWEGGDFQKKHYRHIKIREVPGIDDYSMMRETIKRVITNLEFLPELILIDGGKGHLEVAMETIKDILDNDSKIAIIAIAKSPDRVFLPDGRVIGLDDGGYGSLLLIKIRDEVHRFAISFHRKLRSKEFLESPLLKIKGIGQKRRLALLKYFGSIQAIRQASVEEIASVKGMNRKLAEKLKSELK